MKSINIKLLKIAIICSLIVFGENFVFGQWNPTGANTTQGIYRSGDVTIGTNSSANPNGNKLYVVGTNGVNGAKSIMARGPIPSSAGSHTSAIWGGNQSGLGWTSGVTGQSYQTTPGNAGRAFGVLGEAGNATSNFNYGVMGRILGGHDGAAIVGLDRANYSTWNGNTQGSWAGLFKGSVHVSENVGIGTTKPIQNLDVNGRIHVADGVIQRGGNAITNTSDLGLYSLDQYHWMRFVTNDAPIRFFSDGGTNPIGSNALMSIEPNGNIGLGTTIPTKKLHVHGGNAIIKGKGNFLNAGDQATLCLGDDNHTITSENNKGVTIGTFGVPNGIFLEQSTGRVGIGETTPIQKLDVNGRMNVADGVIQRGGATITGTSDLGLYSLNQYHWMRFVTNDAPIKFFSDGGTDPIGGANNELLTIEPNGKVKIGTLNAPSVINSINTSNFKLFVKDGIATEEIVVATGWCDYVFEDDYKLTSLQEVETHIQEKGHLHNVPSAHEIESNGLELGEMTVNQQEKIEEIFLHLIAMNKEVDLLKVENQRLQEALDSQKK